MSDRIHIDDSSCDANNPISKREPLLDLLVRVGAQFVIYYTSEEYPNSNRVQYRYGADEIWCYQDGMWIYRLDGISDSIREAYVATEAELVEFLHDTQIGDALFRYKLNLLHQVISS